MNATPSAESKAFDEAVARGYRETMAQFRASADDPGYRKYVVPPSTDPEPGFAIFYTPPIYRPRLAIIGQNPSDFSDAPRSLRPNDRNTMNVIRPEGWQRPRGYSHATAASGTTIFLSGQIAWDEHEQFTADDLPGQVRQALANILALVAEAGGSAESVARMTWYVVDKRDYLANAVAIGEAYRDVMGRHFPAMSVVQVCALVEDRALVEIEATAVV